jgi:hypothetical protein
VDSPLLNDKLLTLCPCDHEKNQMQQTAFDSLIF